MTFVSLEIPQIKGLEAEQLITTPQQNQLRRESLVADVRDRVVEGLLRRNFDTWINLETAPALSEGNVPFILRLGMNQNVPIHGTGVEHLVQFLKTGVLNFRYFNANEEGIFPPRRNPNDLPTNHQIASLIVIEGFVDKNKVANAMVLGPSPYVSRLESGQSFTIEEVSRIGICRPTNSAHGKRLINEIRSALEE